VLSKLRSHLTYANVVSSVCLFIVLGGTSYAVATGSIDSREIKNNTVRSKDLRNNTVRSRDVRNFSLLARDFRPGQLLRGPRGRRGPRGPRGRRGTPGENATKLFAYIRDDNPLDTHTATVHYGSGVTGVSDPGGNNAYTVTFNRSLVDCVVQAVGGRGDPAGSAAAWGDAIPLVSMSAGNVNQASVQFVHGNPEVVTDTSFLVTAFC